MFNVLNLRRISGQITALVVMSIVAIHIVLSILFTLMRPDQNDPQRDRGHGELIAIVRLLRSTPAAERPALLANLKSAFPHFDIRAVPPDATITTDDGPEYPRRSLRGLLGSDARLLKVNGEPDRIGITLPGGEVLSFSDLPEIGRAHV